MIYTRACDVLGITHPVVQAGMAYGYTNASLVAAVSQAGGLGILGCLGRSATETASDVEQIRTRTDRPFGVNFVVHHLDEETFATCLAERVPVFSFFRGDPTVAIDRARETGAKTIFQATTKEEAVLACSAGVDVLIAQGMEAGGHMGPAALGTIVPTVVRVAGDRPVLAAGGIVDGCGLAAALCLGASGVSMGTRFLATPESPVSDAEKEALVRARPGETVASLINDIIGGGIWPGVQVRTLRNDLIGRWLGQEDALLAVREEVLSGVVQAERAGDIREMLVLAGEGVGLIDAISPAGEIVATTAREAATILAVWSERIGDTAAY